jgi:beta-lactamase regulating signal transducer with metallopeptidase domain
MLISFMEALNRYAEVWLGTMLAVLWQSALLIVLATVFAWFLRRSSPNVRYWLWQIVAIKLLVMPFWTVALPLPSWAKPFPTIASSAGTATTEQNTDAPQSISRKPILTAESVESENIPQPTAFWQAIASGCTWQTGCFSLWFFVVTWQCVRLWIQHRRLAVLLRHGQTVDPNMLQMIAELSLQSGLRRVPTVISVDGDCPMFVCGLAHPKLVLPNSLLASLGPVEHRQIILHELAHLRRHDLSLGWLIEIAKIVYWFHPLVYWVAYQLRLERELACDHWAMVQSGHPAADYAQTLIQVVSHGPAPITAQSAAIAAGLSGSETTQNRIRKTEEPQIHADERR